MAEDEIHEEKLFELLITERVYFTFNMVLKLIK